MAARVSEFAWPEGLSPNRVPVWVRNVALIDARADIIWSYLVRAERWPLWYPYARNVRISDSRGELHAGCRFEWCSVGVNVRSQVCEFAPNERLAWSASTVGARIYHAWRIEDDGDGRCRVTTEESQRGWLPSVSRLLLGRIMREHHTVWLEHLKAVSLAAKGELIP